MFCPSCGTENSIGLPYCNRCGANLVPVAAAPEPIAINLTKPILIIGTVITLLTLGGFGMVIAGAIELSRSSQFGSDPIIATIVMGMLTIMTADVFLVRQLSKIINASLGLQKGSRRVIAPGTPAHLPPLTTPHLTPKMSVTENTTRFLESSSPTAPEPGQRAPVDRVPR